MHQTPAPHIPPAHCVGLKLVAAPPRTLRGGVALGVSYRPGHFGGECAHATPPALPAVPVLRPPAHVLAVAAAVRYKGCREGL
jgi:hypothetical protein